VSALHTQASLPALTVPFFMENVLNLELSYRWRFRVVY